MKAYFLIVAAWVITLCSMAKAEAPPVAPFKSVSACNRYVLIMLKPTRTLESIRERLQYVLDDIRWSEADKKSISSYDQDELETYTKYDISGLYLNDGSTNLLWAIDYQYGSSYFVYPDGIHLVIYNAWSGGMDNIPIRFYKRGLLIRKYTPSEILHTLGIRNQKKWADLGLGPISSLNENQLTLVSRSGDQYVVFDVNTGNIVASHNNSLRTARWIVLIGVFILIGISISFCVLLMIRKTRR